jgi:hypothetical protein
MGSAALIALVITGIAQSPGGPRRTHRAIHQRVANLWHYNAQQVLMQNLISVELGGVSILGAPLIVRLSVYWSYQGAFD